MTSTHTENSTGSTDWTVVRNDEDQYSLWWADRDLPAGWSNAGYSGSRPDCLRHIESVWTDMRPASLRHQLDSDGAS